MSAYLDPVDGSTYPLEVPRWRSEAGRPLWINPGGGIAKAEIDSSTRSIWRYRAALPLHIEARVSLGEGLTPLVEKEWAGARPLFKLDFLNPTGSFKDRGTSVMLSYLKDRGITAVLEDSSGNGGSSVAGYAAAGNLSATIFAPASTSASKIDQVRAYGARVELVDGPREESQNAAIARSGEGSFYSSHNWQPFFLQGTKTLAYEIWEDLGFRAPHNVIVPVGAGSSLLGCWLGFSELVASGAITRIPRLFAAQPFNCSPVDSAFRGTRSRNVSPTIAEGTAIARPLRLAQMLAAIGESGGGTVAVPEHEIINALGELCSRGIFVEPTSSTAGAALTTLLAEGTIEPDQTSVVVLTGSGLKAASTVSALVDSL